jgi:hypothetical protein
MALPAARHHDDDHDQDDDGQHHAHNHANDHIAGRLVEHADFFAQGRIHHRRVAAAVAVRVVGGVAGAAVHVVADPVRVVVGVGCAERAHVLGRAQPVPVHVVAGVVRARVRAAAHAVAVRVAALCRRAISNSKGRRVRVPLDSHSERDDGGVCESAEAPAAAATTTAVSRCRQAEGELEVTVR